MAIVDELMVETDNNEVAPSLWRSNGSTDALVRTVPLWGPLFDFVGNYELGVLMVLEMLTSMRPVTEKVEELSR